MGAPVAVQKSVRSSSIIDKAEELTPAVLAAMSHAPDRRLRQIMASLVRHAHDFAREARLTEQEWEIGIDFLNRIGKATNARHNEAVLFSDAVGFSTLVCLLNNGNAGSTETASALLGPFWRADSPVTPNGGSILRSDTPGPALFVDARVTDPLGRPLGGVEVDVWQSSPVGLYENQDPSQADMNLRGKFLTDADGRFSFRSVKPAGYPVPTDGPVGDLLRAQDRAEFRPAHIHFLCFRDGYKTLVTQVFVDDDERLGDDVVFGVTSHLVGDFRPRGAHETLPDGSAATGAWHSLDHTFVMEPGEAKLPVPPIA